MIVRDRILLVLLAVGALAGAVVVFESRRDESPRELTESGPAAEAPTSRNSEVRRSVETPRPTTLPVVAATRPTPIEARPSAAAGEVFVRVVIDGTKETLSGVGVRVFGPQRPWNGAVLAEGVTNESGRVRLSGLPEGELAIEVMSREWAPRVCPKSAVRRLGKRRLWIAAPTKARVASITVPVLSRFAIEGIVVDQTGVPMPDVTIEVDDPAQRSQPPSTIEPILSGRNGRFRLEELAYVASVVLDAHSPVAAMDEPLHLEPIPGETIGGLRVVVHRFEWVEVSVFLRTPMPQALGGVSLFAVPMGWRSRPVAPAVTDPFGKAILRLERSTRYWVHIHTATLPEDVMFKGDDQPALRAIPSENTEYVVRLDTAYPLRGCVKTEDDKPVAGGTLVFMRRGDDSRTYSTTTKADGEFFLKVPTEGPHDIVDGYAWVRTTNAEGKFSQVKVSASTITPRTLIAGAAIEPVEIIVN